MRVGPSHAVRLMVGAIGLTCVVTCNAHPPGTTGLFSSDPHPGRETEGDPSLVGGDARSSSCSPGTPAGVCPPAPGGQPTECVQGVCWSTDQVQACDLAHPDGHCPSDRLCVDGSCETPNQENACSPTNPHGVCGYRSACFDGICYPVRDDERCTASSPFGLCPPDQFCTSGQCENAPAGERCSPSNPNGRCDAWEQCVGGECSEPIPPDACSAERIHGRCPSGDACVDGVCETITPETACSRQSPTGLCPWDAYCADGYCRPIFGPRDPCSPINTDGECPPSPTCTTSSCQQTCVNGICTPNEDLSWCDLIHLDGYCPMDLLCVDGLCAAPSPENTCSPSNHAGACTVGSACLDGVCYPVRDDERCSLNNPGGICPPDQYCNGGSCVDVPAGERCSPSNLNGHCDAWEECVDGGCSASVPPDACSSARPYGRCAAGEACVDGMCEAITDQTACGPDNTTGLCPRDSECVDGYCVPATGTHAPCGPDNPHGVCPINLGCTTNGCVQISPTNVCSIGIIDGLCPAGMECRWILGKCRLIDSDEACSPENPDGPCADWAICTDGECTFTPCDLEHPAGQCPNALICHYGECLFPYCGPAVPYSGICPPGYVCSEAVCRSLNGDPCSAAAPAGYCADPGQTCDDRVGSATFGACVWSCNAAHHDGYCGMGLTCYDGWCLDTCTSGVVCAYSGVCCADAQECIDDAVCVPGCDPSRVRCNQDQICCPDGFECWADEYCTLPCDNAQRCGVYGELCCGADETCSPELVCAPTCAAGRELCGLNLDVCCQAGETCVYDQCIVAGTSCSDFLDCSYGEYCEPTLASCLPAELPGGEVCQNERPPQIFNPISEWRWTGVWPACDPSMECRGGECAVLCAQSSDCQGVCAGHRCECTGDIDCANGTQNCRDSVCVWSGSSCGERYENVMSIATVADLDQDGYPEVIFRAYAGAILDQSILVILDGRDGGDGSGPGSPPEAVLSPALDSNIPWLYAAGHQAVANLDDDSALEIVAVAATGLVAFNDPGDFDPADGDGAVLWQSTAYPLDRTLDGGAPTIADINGDGQVEVVMGAAVLDGRSGAILAVPPGGAALEGGGSRFGGGWISIVADVDLDGKPEVITGNRAWNVEEAGGVWSMSLLWESVTAVPRPPDYTSTVDIPHGFSAVANFYVSGAAIDYPEVVNVAGGNLYLLDGLTGSLLAGPIVVPAGTAGQNHGGPPTVADFDGDGRPEVAAAGGGCYTVYDFDCLAGYDAAARTDTATLPGCAIAPQDRCGSYPSMIGVLWNYKSQDFSSACTGSSVFDFDGDGVDEVLYNDECFFRVFDGRTGAVLMERPNTSRTNSEYPIVVDVDGDRNSEILLVANHDQVTRDHCVSNYDNDPSYDSYLHYDDLTGAGEYCDLSTFPSHTRECTQGAAGITVFGDISDRWVKTRPLWHQHAYHITDVELDAQTWSTTTPTQERRSWEDSNTYRKNVRGSIPLNAPDIQVTAIIPVLYTCPTITLNARIANLGAQGIEAGLPVSLYGLWQDPPVYLSTTYTLEQLLPGAGEYVSLSYAPTASQAEALLGFRIVADDDGTDETLVECREDNNTAEIVDLGCQAVSPIARCLVLSPAPDDIGPLETVVFDGSFSYDPRDPTATDAIASYSWEVVQYPDSAWIGDFVPQGNGTPYYGIWLPTAGSYTVRLTVTDQAGLPSVDTADSSCTIEVTPKSNIHIELVWNNNINDQDLHLVWRTNATGDRRLFRDDDCYYANPLPDWFGNFDQDPRLDIDDTYGYGPENINIDHPAPGIYRIYANYAANHLNYRDTPPTVDTVLVYLAGVLDSEFSRTMTYPSNNIWAIADIVWNADDDFYLVPLPGDIPADPSIVGYTCELYRDWTNWWSTTCPTDP